MRYRTVRSLQDDVTESPSRRAGGCGEYENLLWPSAFAERLQLWATMTRLFPESVTSSAPPVLPCR
jgi:hypothetical protein